MRMLLAQRLFGALPVLFGVSIVIFALIHLAPGDVTTALLGPQATERDRAELRHTLGLDQPLPVQYAKWLARTAAGDFGTSIAT
jgi:peptide/nickel transport system permease protein